MDTLEKELAELKNFIGDLKADRAAQKEKEKRESWTKYVSMSLVFVAVLAAVATQRGAKYSGTVLVSLNKSTLNQAKASDAWNEFQANSTKQNLYDALHEMPSNRGITNSAEYAKWEELYVSKTNKYASNKEKKSQEAKDLEAERAKNVSVADDMSAHSGKMALPVSAFQISIALGSICLVTKKKWLWYVSLLLAAAATMQMINVWIH